MFPPLNIKDYGMICDYRLKVFYTVAVKGSFTAAAKELGITQPAVSNHISELENAIGDTLFHRSRRETGLTQKGKILFNYAEKILHLYRCADRELVPSCRDERKHLTIAAVPDAARFILRPLADHYSKIYQSTDLSIVERSQEEIASMLEDSAVDIAISDICWDKYDNNVFACLTINGSASPMIIYYIYISPNRRNDKVINEFLLCCKTYR